jgi:hypothetical protein
MPEEEQNLFWEMHANAYVPPARRLGDRPSAMAGAGACACCRYDSCFSMVCNDPVLVHNATVAVKRITSDCQRELASDVKIDCSASCLDALTA